MELDVELQSSNPGIKWYEKWRSNPKKTEMICEICSWVTWRPYFEWDPDWRYTRKWMKKHREFCPSASNPISRHEYEEYWREPEREYGYLWIDGKKTHVVLSPIPEKLKEIPGYEEYNWVVEILEYRPDAQYYRYFKEKPKLEHSSNPNKDKEWDAADSSKREEMLAAAGVLAPHRWSRFSYAELPPAIKAMLERANVTSKLTQSSEQLSEKPQSEVNVERDWNNKSIDTRYSILDAAIPLEALPLAIRKRELKKYASFAWRALPIAVKNYVKERYRKYLEKPEVEVKEELGLYYQATFEPKIKELKFPAPPRVRIPIKEEVKHVERKVEPGLARFGIPKPEQPLLDAYLNLIEKAKQVALEKKKLEGK